MTGLLDGGLRDLAGAMLSGVYLDGTLHRATRTDAEDGDVSISEDDAPIKGHVDQITEAMRAAAGYTAKQQRLIVLQSGVAGAPTTDDEITLGGVRWTISNVEADPAGTHWIIRGEKSAAPA